MLAYLAAVEAAAELYLLPNFGAHQLTGKLAGIWCLAVTKNWRMTFSIGETGAVEDLDLEDYH